MPTNRLYPGKPNYKGPTVGYFTLLHHTGPLIEWSDNVMERVKYIEERKDANERPIRLRHIVYLPVEMIPKTLQKAYAEWQKADTEWQKAYTERQKAYAEWQKADAEWQKADTERQKADADKLLAYLHEHIEDCKWDGKELVFEDKP